MDLPSDLANTKKPSNTFKVQLSANNLKTPKNKYNNMRLSGVIEYDVVQEKSIEYFEQLYHQYHYYYYQRSIFEKVRDSLFLSKPLKGIYIWGGVGRGKTYLMDLFFNTLPKKNTIRFHFHHFMKHIHQQLKKYQGKKNPLQLIAKNEAKKYHLIAFDEFYVSDITDAMLLGELFKTLFQYHVCIVITSNRSPCELYKNGLQREQFLPAIDAIEKNCHIIHLDHNNDYRLKSSQQKTNIYIPHTDKIQKVLIKRFKALACPYRMMTHKKICINQRWISTECYSKRIIWFSFHAICETPRNSNDYIEIAQKFSHIIISEIPQFTSKDHAALRRFIALIDEFYESDVHVIMSTKCSLPELYKKNALQFEFQRTLSRLQAMK
jgi:cell division protein ZapE